jgi:hypothetical protein
VELNYTGVQGVKKRLLGRLTHVGNKGKMGKTTVAYWNPLNAANHDRCKPVKELENMAEELTLSVDKERDGVHRLRKNELAFVHRMTTQLPHCRVKILEIAFQTETGQIHAFLELHR